MPAVTFANFVCRFGDRAVMLDLAEDIVFPAFLSGRSRKYGDSTYSFQNVSVENFGSGGSPELVLVGRMVLDTILSRDQVLIDGELVRDHATMPSAPSALFALVLDSHKLIYLPETRSAPALSAFRATAAHLIKDQHRAHINKLYEDAKNTEEKVTKRELLEQIPYPTIEVVALSSDASLEQFLNQFNLLQQIRIELIEPNDELDGSPLIKQMREAKMVLGAKSAALAYGNTDGLSQTNAVNELRHVIEEGNAKVILSGKDNIGDKLKGNNEAFKLSIPIADISSDAIIAGRELYRVFRDKVDVGLLRVKIAGEDIVDKIKRIADSL
jgi:hypothetical protein